MHSKTLNKFIEHVKKEYPKEACGFILSIKGKERYFKAYNKAKALKDHFIIDPISYADAEDTGEILAICHSHPDKSCKFSEQDIKSCNASKIPWFIFSWPEGKLNYFQPKISKLIGRQFVHGTTDCYSLCQDYYKETLNISLEYFNREDEWWDKGENLYINNFKAQGFIEVSDDIKKHDGFLMKVLSPVPNHAAIFIGENKILHHLYGRLSNREIYNKYWRNHTTHHLRHKSLC